MKIVLALGGNSLIEDPLHQSVLDQWVTVRKAARCIADLILAGHQVVVTHGNGPQVGFILMRSEIARGLLHEVPLDSCGADSQGAIGYQLQQSLGNALAARGRRDLTPVTVVTRVRVDPRDPAFENPTKPIGPFLEEKDARNRQEREGWSIVEDAGRGWRRVVASPRPLEILELPAIRHLWEGKFVVIAVGGGGIPVVLTEEREYRGVPAVIDKDRASALLAKELRADALIISTGVEHASAGFGTESEEPLRKLGVSAARTLLAAGEFPPGSMGPKMEAAAEFVDAGGGFALITSQWKILEGLAERAGTRIVPG